MLDTTIHYLYRDGSNYKFRATFCVQGELTLGDMEPFLIDGQFFLPNALGIPSLVPVRRNEDDHELHEIEQLVHEPALARAIPVSQFLHDLKASSDRGWFLV